MYESCVMGRFRAAAETKGTTVAGAESEVGYGTAWSWALSRGWNSRQVLGSCLTCLSKEQQGAVLGRIRFG